MEKKSARLKTYEQVKNERKQRRAQRRTEKRKFEFDTYYKVVGSYSAITILLYILIQNLETSGYKLINTAIVYWAWFAMVVGIVLLVARFIANLPRSQSTRRTVKICAIVMSVVSIVMMFFITTGNIKDGWHVCAQLKAPEGDRTILLMRSDLTIKADENKPEKIYTMYGAYPRINAMFCDPKCTNDTILLLDDPDAEIKMEWSDGELTLFTEGSAVDGMDTIKVPAAK